MAGSLWTLQGAFTSGRLSRLLPNQARSVSTASSRLQCAACRRTDNLPALLPPCRWCDQHCALCWRLWALRVEIGRALQPTQALAAHSIGSVAPRRPRETRSGLSNKLTEPLLRAGPNRRPHARTDQISGASLYYEQAHPHPSALRRALTAAGPRHGQHRRTAAPPLQHHLVRC